MRKLVKGLVGILFLFTAGCTVYQANEDVNKIRYHVRSIKKIIGADPNDSYNINDPKKKSLPLEVVIVGKNYIKRLKYLDSDGNGIYDKTELNTLEIPDKLDIKILPPLPKPEPKQYIPEKKKEKEYVVLR